MTDLFSPLETEALSIKNRAVMAPLTRCRADAQGVLPDYAATYYAQRAGAGLIITEATSVSPMSAGFRNTPGIYNQQQIVAWQNVAEAVHSANGTIFMQVWHTGRISHTSLTPEAAQPIAPSAVEANDGVAVAFTSEGPQKPSPARALSTEEVLEQIALFRSAFENAKAAGMDGIEIHAANGFLINQFITDNSNKRTDEYGGSIANRIRFALEIVKEAVAVFGGKGVGIRISPRGMANDQRDSDIDATFTALVKALNQYSLAYLHLVETPEDAPEGRGMQMRDNTKPLLKKLRALFDGVLMINSGYDLQSANKALSGDAADLVAFGTQFLANPDLVERLKAGAPLNVPDNDTFYSGGEQGYTDYPVLDNSEAKTGHVAA